MSNVIIGIIGVVLFIGLALAGALFLGPRFQESTNNSRAAASVQAVSQISSAANMYNVQEGRLAPDVLTLDTDQYLKSVPANPTDGGTAPAMVDADGVAANGNEVVQMVLGGNDAAICEAIQKQTAGTDVIDPTLGATAASQGPVGCFGADETYTAFARI